MNKSFIYKLAAYLSALFISVTCFNTVSIAQYIDEGPVDCYVDDQNRTIDCFPAQNRIDVGDDYIPAGPPPFYADDCGGYGEYGYDNKVHCGDNYFGYTAAPPYNVPPYYSADTGPACGSYPLDNEINMPPDINMPHMVYPADLPKPDERYSSDRGACPVDQAPPTSNQGVCPDVQDQPIDDGTSY